nr:MAG TPA: DNA gyrase/topoisomerase IV, subunit A [Caudoviricetes sp.]
MSNKPDLLGNCTKIFLFVEIIFRAWYDFRVKFYGKRYLL